MVVVVILNSVAQGHKGRTIMIFLSALSPTLHAVRFICFMLFMVFRNFFAHWCNFIFQIQKPRIGIKRTKVIQDAFRSVLFALLSLTLLPLSVSMRCRFYPLIDSFGYVYTCVCARVCVRRRAGSAVGSGLSGLRLAGQGGSGIFLWASCLALSGPMLAVFTDDNTKALEEKRMSRVSCARRERWF